MFWKTYLLSKMPIVSVSLFCLGGWIHVSQLLGRLFLGFFFGGFRGSEPHWLDKEKAEPSESAGVTGGSRAPRSRREAANRLLQRRNRLRPRIRRENHGKNVFCFFVVNRILFLLFFLGWGGGTGLADFFFVKWCNVRDWAKFVLSWCP